jgi:hypothetical protein
MADVSLEAFENDWQRQWLVERGVEIVSAPPDWCSCSATFIARLRPTSSVP